MKDAYERVEDEVITVAYGRFIEMYHNGSPGMGLYFWEFIGCTRSPAPDRTVNGHWRLPAKAANTARLLAGPHYEMIAKMLVIRGHRYDRKLGE